MEREPPTLTRGSKLCRQAVRALRRHLRALRKNRASPLYVDGDDPSQQAVLVAGARASAAVVRALCQASKYHDGHTCACARIAMGSGKSS